MEFNFVEILILFIGVYLLLAVNKLDDRVKGMQRTLDQISKHSGVPEKAIADELQHELRQLVNEGNYVTAVKKARETLGLSLLEAKKYVDALKIEGK
ncbi:hypothetical protein [Paenibacillus sp. 481]|uniref:hypothetical protein n=1 Tax=Paenibacillus sp. 481 TaxID=2835869 RepID=UPI001E2C715C|nr:hypothetical protein [Paenibacillus sp. 481]UHA74690.1 hypothetical protein KIK04_06335 [Paenibacillus sp. 481]